MGIGEGIHSTEGHTGFANVTQTGLNSSFVNVYFQLWINTYLERNTRTVYDRLKITTVSVGFFFIVFGHTINKDMQDLGYTCKMCS